MKLVPVDKVEFSISEAMLLLAGKITEKGAPCQYCGGECPNEKKGEGPRCIGFLEDSENLYRG
jgi:hypothetical protein